MGSFLKINKIRKNIKLKKYWKLSPEEVVKNAPLDYGIIQLAIIFSRINNPDTNWNKQNNYFKWGTIPHVGSTLAYIINRKCVCILMVQLDSESLAIFNPYLLYWSPNSN